MKDYPDGTFVEKLRSINFFHYSNHTCVNNTYQDFVTKFFSVVNSVARIFELQIELVSRDLIFEIHIKLVCRNQVFYLQIELVSRNRVFDLKILIGS